MVKYNDPAYLSYQKNMDDMSALNAELRARNYAALEEKKKFKQQQQLSDQEFGQKQQLSEQGYQQNWQLAQQQYDAQADQQDVRNLHEDELFERHHAGAIAEMHLQHLQQSKMAEFQAQKQMEQQGSAQDFAAEQQGRSQDFQAQQQEAGFGQQTKMANISGSQAMDRQDSSQQYGADSQMYSAMTQAAAEHVRMKSQEAREEILRRHADDTLDKNHKFEADTIKHQEQTRLMQENMKAIANGDMEIDQGRWNEIGQEMANIRRNPRYSEDQKGEYIQSLEAERADMALHPDIVPEWKKKQTEAAAMQSQWQRLDPSVQGRAQWSKKDGMWKEEFSAPKQQAEQITPETFSQQVVSLDPKTGKPAGPEAGGVPYHLNPKTGSPTLFPQPEDSKSALADKTAEAGRQKTEAASKQKLEKITADNTTTIYKAISKLTGSKELLVPTGKQTSTWGGLSSEPEQRPLNEDEKWAMARSIAEKRTQAVVSQYGPDAQHPPLDDETAAKLVEQSQSVQPAQPAAAGAQLPPDAKQLPNGDIQGPDGKIYRRKTQ